MWRGRLPHWRADDVHYYVTFRHRRALSDDEREILFHQLFRTHGRQFEVSGLWVGPETSELIFTVDQALELSEVIEKAKQKAGKLILKKSGERFPPFYHESFDRIIRDEAEFEERIGALIEQGVDEFGEESPYLFMASAP